MPKELRSKRNYDSDSESPSTTTAASQHYTLPTGFYCGINKNSMLAICVRYIRTIQKLYDDRTEANAHMVSAHPPSCPLQLPPTSDPIPPPFQYVDITQHQRQDILALKRIVKSLFRILSTEHKGKKYTYYQ